MGLELTIVDAFTDRPFTGNPAAVSIVEQFPAVDYMQCVAREMNLSETAFVVPRDDGDHDLRWFTPLVEVNLCGHATLASAQVLGGSARFHTRSGVLVCARGDDGSIEMDFPADRPSPDELPSSLAMSGVRWFGRGREDVLIELEDAESVRELTPDLGAFSALESRAVIVTAHADCDGFDCVSRVFAPNCGIPEDPVTGSAHCTLAVYWGERLGKDRLTGRQESARGGTVRMTRNGDRVGIAGQAVQVARVSLEI